MIDKSSPEWPGFKAWLQVQIERDRSILESPNCRAIAEADQLRGKIMAWREIIATVEPPVVPLAAPAHDRGGPY
jgi:hypothetical protein